MRVSRAVQIKMDGFHRVNSIYSSGRMFKKLSSEIHADFMEFKQNLPKRTPQWVRSYFDGVADLNVANYYKDSLHFCYKVKGEMFSTDRTHSRYYEKFNISPKFLNDHQESSGHYWIEEEIVNPFYISEVDVSQNTFFNLKVIKNKSH